MTIRMVFLAAACLVAPQAAGAHDLWLTLDGILGPRAVIVNYGHPKDRPPTSIVKIVDLVAITDTMQLPLRDGLRTAMRDGAVVAISNPVQNADTALFAARFDNGLWVKTPDGYRNATRRLTGPGEETVWSGKFAKAIGRFGAPWSRIMGHDLEIVPLADPAFAAAGRMLKVRVLFRGQPLQNADVERGDGFEAVPEANIPRFKTDGDGVAAVPIAKPGPTLLVVDHRVAPSLTPDQADADLYNATFWFEAGVR